MTGTNDQQTCMQFTTSKHVGPKTVGLPIEVSLLLFHYASGVLPSGGNSGRVLDSFGFFNNLLANL